LWFVRDQDHISTQLSAHGADSGKIDRSIDLDDMLETVDDLEALINTLSPSDKAKVRKVSTKVRKPKVKP
jgi:hypothetical protein